MFSSAVGCGGSTYTGGGSAAPSEARAVESSTPAGTASAGQFGSDSAAFPAADEAAPAAPPPPPAAVQGTASQRPGAFEAEAKRAEVMQPEPPQNRPGLGTEWGETRSSSITTVAFQRAEPTSPFSMASLFYNDEEGARAMANAVGFRRTSGGVTPVAGGALLVGLRDENGAFLNGFVASDKNYIVGEAGRRYTIVIRNRTPNRIECVVSVDGLDVIDGRAAGFSKRGYLVQPHGELEIDGFRQSVDAVAAFRFGSVRGSYAAKKSGGDSRNVGVIGFAFFHERGTNPFPWTNDEVNKRHDANPFPGQFATPP
ncbi:hypothetical protein KEG38_02940 [Polyangium jinanense]|uniref:Outer membrane lipoprotein n=1 Tax=Polyangium jinanense TaxID=2829994 RepID=A0A9X3WY03_9BACT|nr:hypothetical protein [Polyangium jinanense]MDC3980397.1 hypothetical protein [Polyangium jinanense]